MCERPADGEGTCPPRSLLTTPGYARNFCGRFFRTRVRSRHLHSYDCPQILRPNLFCAFATRNLCIIKISLLTLIHFNINNPSIDASSDENTSSPTETALPHDRDASPIPTLLPAKPLACSAPAHFRQFDENLPIGSSKNEMPAGCQPMRKEISCLRSDGPNQVSMLFTGSNFRIPRDAHYIRQAG